VTPVRRIELVETIESTAANDVAARDRDWVARICTGDKAAFEAMFRVYKNDLGVFIDSYVQSRAVAEELLQELFLYVWDRRYVWAFPGPLNAYLFRAARNRAISYLRRERLEIRFRERLIQDQNGQQQLASAPGVVEQLEAQDMEKVITRAVNHLPDRCREVFVLSRYHHLSYMEIAEVLGISVKTVEVQMGRALTSLRQRLASWRK
jgi:RNA polymerase sigma-70 factor (ECF subfamily)